MNSFWSQDGNAHTSSNGLVSLKQLSQTSFTARSAAATLGHAGLAATEIAARRRTHAYNANEAISDQLAI